jgi:hypothetical protein
VHCDSSWFVSFGLCIIHSPPPENHQFFATEGFYARMQVLLQGDDAEDVASVLVILSRMHHCGADTVRASVSSLLGEILKRRCGDRVATDLAAYAKDGCGLSDSGKAWRVAKLLTKRKHDESDSTPNEAVIQELLAFLLEPRDHDHQET